ncbi:hypothetical protein [Herbaspirillum sp. YR522]|uniref:hypothetical protein n=1 Tax=Herbaspirillum sp. YR522 TaxID=1144342 RepID=UPI00030CE5B1|nr:hypothetical protein [Herbaspirillum sp. YR522]
MSDKQVDAYCEDWMNWCYTRRFYLQPGAQGVLARLQPSKTGEPPNARNSPDMQFFNMAIHMLGEMREHAETFACFKLMYVEQAAHIKQQASKLEISRKTYYNRARAFARRAVSMSQSLKAATEKMRQEKEEEAVVD